MPTGCQVKKRRRSSWTLHITMPQGLQQFRERASSMSQYLGLVHPGLSGLASWLQYQMAPVLKGIN